MIRFRKADKKDLKKCTELLAYSFWGYEYFEPFIKNEKKRYRFEHAIQEVNVKAYYDKTTMLIAEENGEIIAVAQLKSPEDKDACFWDYIKAGGLKVIAAGGLKNTFSWLDMFDKTGKVCHEYEEPHWYLSSLAVSLKAKGRGVGTRMLRDCIIPYISLHGGGLLMLITNSEKNREFYKKNGFEEFSGEIMEFNGYRMGNWGYRMEIDDSLYGAVAV